MNNCSCIKDTEEKAIAHFKDKNPDWEIEPLNHWEGTGLQPISYMMGGRGDTIHLDLKMRYTFTKTNGQRSALKSKTVSIMPNFCPFCGIKFEDQSNNT